jgi:hypothetical protein
MRKDSFSTAERYGRLSREAGGGRGGFCLLYVTLIDRPAD